MNTTSTSQKLSNNNSSYNRKSSSNIPCRKGQDCHFNKQGRCMFLHPQLSQSKQTITKPTFTYHSSDFPALNSVTK